MNNDNLVVLKMSGWIRQSYLNASMSISQPACPACDSTHIVKNGKIHNGKQNFKCRECGRQFVQDPQNKIIDEATKS